MRRLRATPVGELAKFRYPTVRGALFAIRSRSVFGSQIRSFPYEQNFRQRGGAGSRFGKNRRLKRFDLEWSLVGAETCAAVHDEPCGESLPTVACNLIRLDVKAEHARRPRVSPSCAATSATEKVRMSECCT